MASKVAPPGRPHPVCWNSFVPLPSDAVRLLKEVAEDIDEEKYVALKTAAESLGSLNNHFDDADAVRQYVERFLKQVIDILLFQQPVPSLKHDRNYIYGCIKLAALINESDLQSFGIEPKEEYRVLLNVKGLKITLLDMDDPDAQRYLFTIKQSMIRSGLGGDPSQNNENVPAVNKKAGSYLSRLVSNETKAPGKTTTALVPLTKTATNGTKKKSPTTAKRKITYKHPCIHGKNCNYIKDGRDGCVFYHTDAELEYARAKAASKVVKRAIQIPPNVVGWILGNNGDKLQKMTKRSGAKMWIKTNVKPDENCVVNISGSREAVDAASKMVKEKMDQYDGSTAPVSMKASSGNASAANKELPGPSVASTNVASSDAKSSTDIVPYTQPNGMTAPSLIATANKATLSVNVQTSSDFAAKPMSEGPSDPVVAPACPSPFGQTLLQWASSGPQNPPPPNESTAAPVQQKRSEAEIPAGNLFSSPDFPRLPTQQTKKEGSNTANTNGPVPPPGLQAVPSDRVNQQTSSDIPRLPTQPAKRGSSLAAADAPVPPTPPGMPSLASNRANQKATVKGTPSSPAPFPRMQTSMPFQNHLVDRQIPVHEVLSVPFSVGSTLQPNQQTLNNAQQTVDWSKVIAPPTPASVSVTPPSRSSPINNSALLTFLEEQASCIKGSPEKFYRWLVDTQDIVSLDDLSEATSYDEYLRNVLQPGDGNVGVKGFKLAVFKKAAAEAATPSVPTTATSTEASSSSSSSEASRPPPPELMCPISRVLMTKDPVIAADGYTYERAAIEAYFLRQQLDISNAKRQLSIGGYSPHALAVVNRGVVSPSGLKLPHLHLTPNHALRAMANDIATTTLQSS